MSLTIYTHPVCLVFSVHMYSTQEIPIHIRHILQNIDSYKLKQGQIEHV